MGQNEAKNSDVEAKAQGEDITESNLLLSYEKRNTTNQRFTSFCVSRVELNIAVALRGFYAEAQLENISSKLLSSTFSETQQLFLTTPIQYMASA